MKRIFISIVLVSIALLLNSCGGANLEGNWKIEPSTFDLVLGEGFPDEMKQSVEEAKVEITSARSKEDAKKVTLELQPNGKALLKHDDHPEETMKFNWNQSGKVLNLNGELEGQKFNYNLDILESSSNEATIGLTGESLLEQVKKEMPEALEHPYIKFIDLEKLTKGAKVSIKMVKA